MNNKISVVIKFLRVFLFIQFSVLLNSSSVAQEYDISYTVDFINSHLDDNCKIIAHKKSIEIEYYRNGKVVRKDDFYPSAINIEQDINYSHPEKAFILSCYENAGECVDKQILINDTRTFETRTTLISKCEDQQYIAVGRALKHLIMLYIADDEYLRTKPFEEE